MNTRSSPARSVSAISLAGWPPPPMPQRFKDVDDDGVEGGDDDDELIICEVSSPAPIEELGEDNGEHENDDTDDGDKLRAADAVVWPNNDWGNWTVPATAAAAAAAVMGD